MWKRGMKALLLILTGCFAVLTGYAAEIKEGDGASPSFWIENRNDTENALSFDVRLSESQPNGCVIAALFAETGRLKDIIVYEAKQVVSAALENVSDTDYAKVLWIDAQCKPVAKAEVLRMSKSGTHAYEKFAADLLKALEETGGIAGGDDPYALARLVVRCESLPDLSEYHVAATVPGPNGIYVVQFRTPTDAKNCAEYLRSLPTVRYAEPDRVVRADEGDDNLYALARLIVDCESLPDLSAFGVAAAVPGPDNVTILQFSSPSDAENCAQYLRSLPSVRYVEPDVIVQAAETEPGNYKTLSVLSSGHLSWGVEAAELDRYAESILQKEVRNTVKIAVVDSGVDEAHPFLAGRLLRIRILSGSAAA